MGKNLINIPSGYFKYNSLAVCNWKISEVDGKCIKDWNIRSESINILEENIKRKLLNINIGNDFFF